MLAIFSSIYASGARNEQERAIDSALINNNGEVLAHDFVDAGVGLHLSTSLREKKNHFLSLTITVKFDKCNKLLFAMYRYMVLAACIR